MYIRFIAALWLISLSINSFAVNLLVQNAYIPEAPPNSRVMVAFMELHNNSDHAILIKAIKSEHFGGSELHTTVFKDGNARMLRQEHLRIEAHSTLTLRHGSYHLMLFRPQQAIKPGMQIPFSIHFANGNTMDISIPVNAH